VPQQLASAQNADYMGAIILHPMDASGQGELIIIMTWNGLPPPTFGKCRRTLPSAVFPTFESELKRR